MGIIKINNSYYCFQSTKFVSFIVKAMTKAEYYFKLGYDFLRIICTGQFTKIIAKVKLIIVIAVTKDFEMGRYC